MPITVRVNLTTKEALRRGTAAVGEHTITLTDDDVAAMTPRQRELLAQCLTEDGTLRQPYYTEPYLLGLPLPETFDLSGIAGVMDALDGAIAKETARRAAADAERAAADARRKEEEAENERRQAARRAAREEREAAKQQYIETWISRHPDDMIRQQYADGLLARQWIVDRIWRECVAELGVADLVVESYEGTDVSTLSPAAYRIWLRLKETLPDGTQREFIRFTSIDGDGADSDSDGDGDDGDEEDRYGVELKVPYGPFTFDVTVRLT